jgi:hypothetical protein
MSKVTSLGELAILEKLPTPVILATQEAEIRRIEVRIRS